MTTQINRDDKFLGFPATRLKALLTSWEKGNNYPSGLSDLKALSLTKGACAAFLGEALHRKYIDIGHHEGEPIEDVRTRRRQFLELTSTGEAIVSASARKRTLKPKAEKVLDDILRQAVRLSEDAHAPTAVDQIWVFGSVIDDAKPDVGDLDIVITKRSTGVLKKHGYAEINEQIAKFYPGVVPQSAEYYRREEVWFDRMLYGKRKDPLIAANNIHILIGMHRPCRLVFDAALGGKITPKDYPHHPKSAGRDGTMKDRLVMPNLDFREDAFRPTTASVHRWAPEIDEGLPAVIGTRRLNEIEVGKYGERQLDGQDGFALVAGEGDQRALFHVTRETELDGERWFYRLKVEAVHLGENFNPRTCSWHLPVSMLDDLFGADILRLAHHRHTHQSFATIDFELSFCDQCDSMSDFKFDLYKRLEHVLGRREKVLLPDDYRFGMDIAWEDECRLGYVDPGQFEEGDWINTPISKEAYDAWAEQQRKPEAVAASFLKLG
jgi:predicted nucleotidyltransferase